MSSCAASPAVVSRHRCGPIAPRCPAAGNLRPLRRHGRRLEPIGDAPPAEYGKLLSADRRRLTHRTRRPTTPARQKLLLLDTDGDMTMTSPADEVSDVRSFWETVELWPMRYERWCADRWPYLILVPYFLLAIYGFAFVVLERRIPSDLSGSYEVSSLGIALLVSGAFFKRWEPQFRDALGSLYARGSVEDTPPAHYLEFSKEQASWFSSPWRLLPILSCVAFTFAVNWIVGIEMLRGSTFNAPRSYLVLFGATMTVTLCAWSYAVGAVAWCFCVAARTLWSLSGRGVRLRVFFGHPDNCGGLRPLGDASLGMTYPLLVGCVLLLRGRCLAFFRLGSVRLRTNSCSITSGCSFRRLVSHWLQLSASLPHCSLDRCGRFTAAWPQFAGIRKRVWSPTRSTPAQQQRNGS